MMTKEILVVDDEAAMREALYDWLKEDGYEVDLAESGKDAIAIAGEKSWDVILLDLKMPGMDGIETLKKIKSAYPLTEVVMLTAHATVESAIEGMRFGAFDYLMKPCDMEQLMGKVNEATRKKHGHEEKIREAHVKEIISKRGF